MKKFGAVKKSKKRSSNKNMSLNKTQKNKSLDATNKKKISFPHVTLLEEEEVTAFNNPDSEEEYLLLPVNSLEEVSSDESDSMNIISGGQNFDQRSKINSSQLSSQIGSLFNDSQSEKNTFDHIPSLISPKLVRKWRASPVSKSACDILKKSVSFSSSLVSRSESRNTSQDNSFNCSNLTSILTKAEDECVGQSKNSESEREPASTCSRNLYQRESDRKLKSSVNFSDHLCTSGTSLCDLECSNFNSLSSSWDSADANVLLDSSFNSGNDSEGKHNIYSRDDDYSKKLQDNSNIQLPIFTSTPCKSQTTPPDLINIYEREIFQSLETNDEKLSKITLMVSSMEEDVKHLEQIGKRKESHYKLLQDSIADMNQCLSKAEELNNSISSKTELSNLNLSSLHESSKDDPDCSRHCHNFQVESIMKKNKNNDLKEEYDQIRRDIFSLESRILFIEGQSQATSHEMDHKKFFVNSSAQCVDVYCKEDSFQFHSGPEDEQNSLIKVARPLDPFETNLLDIQNNLNNDIDILKERFADDNLYQLSDDSVITNSEYDTKLSMLKLSKTKLHSTWSEEKKILVSRDITQIEADIQKLKNLRRLISSSVLPEVKSHIRQSQIDGRFRKSKSSFFHAIEKPVTSAAEVITKSRLWRSAKLGLVLPLAIMFIGSVNWLLEPNCCDNFYSISYSPYLEYRYGPPPI